MLVERCDLSDRANIRAFVDTWTGPLHLLINDAGVMATPLWRTAEGWDLGHLALALGLHDALTRGPPHVATPAWSL